MPHSLVPVSAVGAICSAVVFLVYSGTADVKAIGLTGALFLALPGYALTLALFPRSSLGGAARLALGAGLSLAVAALGGLLLDVMPSGLQPRSWGVLLSCVTIGASAVALARHGEPTASGGLRTYVLPDLRQATLFAAALLVMGSTVVVAYNGALQQHTTFTQLWMVPDRGIGQDAIRMGVRNMESATVTYGLRLQVGTVTIREWPGIKLNSTEGWETTVELPDMGPDKAFVEAVLFRSDAPGDPYRRVALWIDHPQLSESEP